jgi:hypothetical protein
LLKYAADPNYGEWFDTHYTSPSFLILSSLFYSHLLFSLLNLFDCSFKLLPCYSTPFTLLYSPLLYSSLFYAIYPTLHILLSIFYSPLFHFIPRIPFVSPFYPFYTIYFIKSDLSIFESLSVYTFDFHQHVLKVNNFKVR